MNERPSVRLATAADCPAIAALFRSCVPRPLVAKTIYGCVGVRQYLADQVRHMAHNDTLFLVVGSTARVVGCAEFRHTPHRIVLTYIAVNRSHRRRGIAQALIAHGMQILSPGPEVVFELDAFCDNAEAIDWYGRLGMRQSRTLHWWSIPLGPAQAGRPAVAAAPHDAFSISGLGSADITHRRYGFSEIQINTRRGRIAIGRLGSGWFRLIQTGRAITPMDPDLIPALRCLAPRAKVLVIADGAIPYEEPRNSARLATAVHLEVAAGQLRLDWRRDVPRQQQDSA